MPATAKKVRAPGAASPAAVTRAKQDGDYIPLKIRFKAWWEGVSVESLLRRQRKAAARQKAANIEIDRPLDLLGADKTDFELVMTIRELVWGKDLLLPGGPDYVGAFLDSTKLKPGSLLLDIAAGLGGSGRSIAVALDALVEGLESNEQVASLGAARSKRLAFEKQAPIAHFQPHNPFLRVNRYDCVYGHEAFHYILDKQNLFGEVWKSLKEEGHLVFTDLMYTAAGAGDTAEMQAWVGSEPEAPDPWTMDDYKKTLEDLGFQFAAFEDESDDYKKMIRAGWAAFAETLDDRKVDRRFVDAMMHEANIWQARVKAIESGHLNFVRVHARRPKAGLR